MKLLKYLILISGFIFLMACQSQSEFASKQTQSTFNPDRDLLEVNTIAHHENDSVTRIYVEIRNDNLLYKFADTSAYPYAELRIFYKIIYSNNYKLIVDSGSLHVCDKLKGEALVAKSIFTKFAVKAKLGHNYHLIIETIDLNKKIQYTMQTEIEKMNRLSKQNFLVLQHGNISYKSNFVKRDTVTILLNNQQKNSARVDCFFKEFPLAPPPYSTKESTELNFIPDSNFLVQVENGTMEMILPNGGFYHVRLDTTSNEGLSLFTYNKSFPGVSSNDEMINCTRFLMTKEEFTNCKEAVNKKEAIDKFWLEIGGSNERAKELLKKYYTRVKEANKYFSAVDQGWKSDRGMIYAVFGEASSIVHRSDEEIWVYGSPINQTTLTFVFKKVFNPFTENLYLLERSQFYRPAWSNAVDQWRQGIYFEGKR